MRVIKFQRSLPADEDRTGTIRIHSPFQIAANDGYRYGFAFNLHGDKPTQEQKENSVRGCGILGCMPKGKGDVATAAVTDWIAGLGKDEFVDQITHNVLKRFTA